VSGGLEVKDSNVGVGIKESSGAQASESVSDNNGVRRETSDYSESDRSVTTGTDATYTIDFTRGRKTVQRTAPGQVYLTLAAPEYEAVQARREAGRPHDSSWDLGGDGWTDGGYSAAFTGLPPSLIPLAEANHVNLREVFERGPSPEGFADRVRAELIARKVRLSPEDNPPSLLSSEESNESPDGSWHGGLPGDGASAAGGFGGGA
jgi:hypothetical protein